MRFFHRREIPSKGGPVRKTAHRIIYKPLIRKPPSAAIPAGRASVFGKRQETGSEHGKRPLSAGSGTPPERRASYGFAAERPGESGSFLRSGSRSAGSTASEGLGELPAALAAERMHGAKRNRVGVSSDAVFSAQDKTRTCTNLIVHYPLKVSCLPISPPGLNLPVSSIRVCKYRP